MTTARVRTILGNAPRTVEEDAPADIVDFRDTDLDVICVTVTGLGYVLFDPRQHRAVFANGPNVSERTVTVDGDTVRIPIITNSAGQDRMVVLIDGAW